MAEFGQFLSPINFQPLNLYGHWVVTEGKNIPLSPWFSTPHISWTELPDKIIRLMAIGLDPTSKEMDQCYKVAQEYFIKHQNN